MLKDVHTYRRIAVSLVTASLLLLIWVPAASAASHAQPSSLIGPKQHYLALGDSLAFGYQPNGDFTHGYVTDLFNDLKTDGVKDLTNYGCPGETSTTFIKGGCPFAPPGTPPQLQLALNYLMAHPGQVSPVTLDIGANDVLPDTDPHTCKVREDKFESDLATVDANLKQTILPQLQAALTVNGKVTGQIVLLNYYDAFQNICPNTVFFTEVLDNHLARDVQGFGIIVNVFHAFGGATVPNPHICSYTWICSSFFNIHPTDKGYHVIFEAIDNRTGY